jgi:hypothetical protein
MVKEQEEDVENISYALKGEKAKRFREFKERIHIEGNAEAARKALFDQMDIVLPTAQG